MSIQLQIAIPLFVAFAALAVIALLRRYFKPEIFIVGIAVLGLAVTMTVSHVTVTAAQKQERQKSVSASSETAKFSRALACQYMLDGRYEAAQDILDDLWRTGEEMEETCLAAARCAVLSGDYASAVQLYSQTDAPAQEREQALGLLAAKRPNDDAMIAYLQKLGQNPGDYGLQAGNIKPVSFDAVKAQLQSAITQELEDYKEQGGKDVASALEKTSQLDSQFAAYLASGNAADKEAVKETLKQLASILKDEPKLAASKELRLARLKGYVLTGEYGQIAAKADRNSEAEELVVLAQLLVSDLITKKDFSENYADRNTDPYKQVLEQCELTLENQDDMSKEQRTKYKNKVAMLKEQVKDPVEFTLRQDLLSQATDGDPAMQSKCYLALAKLENADGNADQAKAYITEALGTAANSDDLNYQIPMNQMTQIIQGTSDASEIMNVAEYVDDALNHSLPLDMQVSYLEGDPAGTDGTGDLSDQMTETVNTSTAMLNIGVIDKDNFSEVKAKVQIQSQKWVTMEELKEHLKVYDCGSQITDFTLEKIEFQSSKIILLCDCSGSMSGSVGSLQQVVRDFAATMGAGEQVCVVGFNSRIDFIRDFSGDKNVVAGYADSIFASGGTALFDSLLEVGQLHTQDINTNNIIIAMTDGQDGNAAGEADMYNKIGAMAAEKGLTVYTVGLGDVDANYLQLMAQCGNGSFLYAKDQEELQAFYSFIHGQLNNQYILTYTAKNKTKNQRVLEISLDEELGSAQKTYYLQEPDRTNEGADAYSPYTLEDTEVTISGFTSKFVYKSTHLQTLTLKGTGFDEGDDVTIRLVGAVKYDLKAEFVDSKTYSVILPAGVAAGQYDLEVSIADSSATLKNELTVAVQGSLKTFTYGAYTFTALESRVDDNGNTVLSGNVTMNDWLRFKGEVSIAPGYQDNAYAEITDHDGFYISYSPDLSTGLANFLAEAGVPISFGALGSFNIYSDPYTAGDYDSFRAEDTDYGDIINLLMFVCDDFSVSIYPDMLKVQGLNFTFKLPFQEQILRGWKQCPDKQIELDTHCLFSATKIGIQGKLKYEGVGDEGGLTLVSLPLTLKSLEISVDTLKNDYAVSAGVGFKALKDTAGLSLSVGFVGGKLDLIGIRQDMIDIPVATTPVPVTIKDFGFELRDLSKIPEGADALTMVLDTEINIIFNVTAASLEKYAPKISKLIDSENEVALAEFKDCTLKLKLREFRLNFSADLVLATVLDVGHVEISLGCFDYNNRLIGMYNAKEVGLRVATNVKLLDWHTANLDLDLNGGCEICIGYPYSGLWFNGTADFEVGWGFLEVDWAVSGDAMAGAFVNSMGNFQFSVILRGENSKGEQSGFHAYVTAVDGFNVKLY
jgi:hypothetical protein